MRGPTEIAYFLSWESRAREKGVRARASIQRAGWATPIVDLGEELRVRDFGDGRRELLRRVLIEHVGREPDDELLDAARAAFAFELRIVAEELDLFLDRGISRTLF